MEGEPTPENAESLKEEVIQALKEKGIDDPGTRDLLQQWLIEEEKRVEEAADYIVAQIELNLERARVYAEGGYVQEAIEGLRDDAIQAQHTGQHELNEKIWAEIRRLKALL